MNIDLPAPFRLARLASTNSRMIPQMGAVLVIGKKHVSGHNQSKTHPEYANPEKHVHRSIHAELSCLSKVDTAEGGVIYVYRELDGYPAMARPCNNCMSFLRLAKIARVCYTIPHEPYWEEEKL
jgi:tRNA(Arg) A34 adenosine deaminase TadA